MLLIVINHEETQVQTPGQEAAGYSAGKMEIPEGSCDRGCQESRGGKQMPPTFYRGIASEGFSCEDDLFSGSHVTVLSIKLGPLAV